MKKFLSLTLLVLLTGVSYAQETCKECPESPVGNWITQASVEMRTDWQHDWVGPSKDAENSGFRGKFLNVILKGELGKHWSYAYRQRFTKGIASDGLLNATDYIYLTYRPTSHWEISGGKQIVAIGGYEYDFAPIDLYQTSEYWNHIACYQFGASVAYNFSEHDQLLFQATQSPFNIKGSDMYGYSLRWGSHHGVYQSIWSANLFEYTPGHWLSLVALGNRFEFSHGCAIVDYTTRATGRTHSTLLGDMTLSAELHVQPIRELNAFVKYSFDKNKDNPGDSYVWAGTQQHHAGVGLEYFPIRGRRDVRLHASYGRTWGKNSNPDGVLRDKEGFLCIGATFRADLLHLKQQFKRCK